MILSRHQPNSTSTLAALSSLLSLLCALGLAGCGSAPLAPISKAPTAKPAKSNTTAPGSASASASASTLPKAGSGRGGYYLDDGPGDSIPSGLESTVDPIPTIESFSRSGNKPYVVFGKTYTPLTDTTTPLTQRGVGSWYGKKFHGQKTSSGELYDMYKITAAHPTLPIPSYARVTNLANGKQIIVRINDRGPFHSSRIIDLSYTAALKLDYIGKGSSQLEVERLLPADIERMAENRNNQTPASIVTLPPAKRSIEDLLASQSVDIPEQLAPATSVAFKPESQPASAGVYLQFGAFAIRANAEAVMARIQPNANKRLPKIDIVQQGSLYRLVSGPFASKGEALDAMAQTAELGVGKPVLLQR